MFLPFFLAVITRFLILQKFLPFFMFLKQPDIFCLPLVIRKSCSDKLLVNGTEKSFINNKVSFLNNFNRLIKLRESIVPRLACSLRAFSKISSYAELYLFKK